MFGHQQHSVMFGISLSVALVPELRVTGGPLEPLPAVIGHRGRVTPWMCCCFIAGPHRDKWPFSNKDTQNPWTIGLQFLACCKIVWTLITTRLERYLPWCMHGQCWQIVGLSEHNSLTFLDFFSAKNVLWVLKILKFNNYKTQQLCRLMMLSSTQRH